MNQLLFLSRNDFRLVFRDPMLRLLLCLPLLILLIIWFVVPLLGLQFPVIRDYQHLILMWAALQTPVMFGFINGFLFLEEKEEGVYQALQVLPLSTGKILLSRNLLGIAFSFMLNLILFLTNGLHYVPLSASLLLALQYSLLGPVLNLLLLAFAQNKVQGMAQFKVYNLLAILPVLVFFLHFWWIRILYLIPTYWSFQSIALLKEGKWIFPLLIGFLVYALLIAALLFILKKRRI